MSEQTGMERNRAERDRALARLERMRAGVFKAIAEPDINVGTLRGLLRILLAEDAAQAMKDGA